MKVVIFAGGYGTRMWPASRKSYPKQFYPLIGGKSFFELTYKRFRKVVSQSDILVSTEEKYVDFVEKQASGIPKNNLIVEPERKDTLGAVGLVVAVIEKMFPGEVVFFSWSDHLIEKEEQFLNAVLGASAYTQKTTLPVSINEEPSYPSVHNGWIKVGDAVEEYEGFTIRQIDKFVEKPNEENAKSMFRSHGYLLHTGYGAWKAANLLSYYKMFVPEMYAGLEKISEAWGTKSQNKVLRQEYHKFKKDSVDFAIFQKIPEDRRLTIATSVGWKDAGTWELFYQALRKKESDNVVEGKTEFYQLDSKGNLVVGIDGKVVSLIGIEDLVIIDTKDGLLVCRMDRTGDVKKLFGILEKGKPEIVE